MPIFNMVSARLLFLFECGNMVFGGYMTTKRVYVGVTNTVYLLEESDQFTDAIEVPLELYEKYREMRKIYLAIEDDLLLYLRKQKEVGYDKV